MKMRARSWSEIAAFYEGLPESQDWKPKLIAAFVQQIANSKYAQGLYAATSVHTLCIGQTPEIEFKRNMLGVELRQNKIEFEFWGTLENENRWKRVCEAQDAFLVLEKFLSSLHWFVEYKRKDA